MARLKNGITGPGAGKVGNVIMYEMYGNTYLRGRPSSYKDKKSLPQLTQRQRLKMIQDFLANIKNLVRITFRQEAVGRSPYHAASSINLKQAFKGEYPNQQIDPASVVLSKGSLPLPLHVEISGIRQEIKVQWSPEVELPGDTRKYDRLIWVVKESQSLGYANFEITNVTRDKGEHVIALPEIENPVDVWVIFRSADEKEISNSMWIGRI